MDRLSVRKRAFNIISDLATITVIMVEPLGNTAGFKH